MQRKHICTQKLFTYIDIDTLLSISHVSTESVLGIHDVTAIKHVHRCLCLLRQQADVHSCAHKRGVSIDFVRERQSVCLCELINIG